MYCVLDTEATGLPKYPFGFQHIFMTELACIIVDESTHKVVDTLDYYIKGDYTIPKETIAFNGITNELVQIRGIPFHYAWNRLNKMLQKYKVTSIICHNIEFDMNLMKEEVRRMNNKMDDYIFNVKPICSYRQIFRNSKWSVQMRNVKLETIYNYFYPDKKRKQSHLALDDCKMLWLCLIKINFKSSDY